MGSAKAMGLGMSRGMFGLVSWVQIMDETEDFLSSGDGLPEPPAYTSYGSPVTHGWRVGEWPQEDDIIDFGSPSPEPDEGSDNEGYGYLSQGKETAGKLSSAFSRQVKPPPPPVLVAVMGGTGTGKTSFVNAVTGKGLTVGHGLEACEYSLSTNFPFIYLRDPPSNGPVGTRDIQTATTGINGREVWLIDTPGFDGTHRSDVDILSTIANWVQQANYERKHFSGIIYLHRIADTRMEGSHMKNLRVFRELCGEKNFGNVILCTTMWDKVSEEEGQRREEELKSKEAFWGNLVSRGAQVMRHRGPDFTASARKIAESFIQKDTIVLRLQEELDRNGSLSDTSAGRFLTSKMRYMKKHQEEIAALRAEIQANSDKEEEIELLKEYYGKEIEGLRKATDDLQKLRAEDETRFRQRLDGVGLQLGNLEGVLQEGDEGLRRATDDLEKLRAENARRFREELQKMQHQLGDHAKCIVC